MFNFKADENSQGVLDLSKKCLKKVPKQEDAQNVKCLILDDNELQKIDNIDSYLRIEKLSLSKNQLLRMYGVCRLHYLKDLNLSYNGILTIEGVKELIHLRYLNLEGNNIKVIEHLNANTKLEVINLSENSIGSVSDVSYLKSLKELNLNGNRITHLRQCDKYLPTSLETLILAKNNITDLNEICTLSHLCNLNSISIADNPCVQMTGNVVGFDYRPFVLNWCMSVKLIDGFVVNPIESLKAEWLYSQGRGRQFRIGEQIALARYLSSVCALTDQALENENERKLRLILSKAQQHQRQLQEEISETSNSGSNSPSSSRRKGPPSRIQSPRFSRLGGRQGSPDSMSNSYHGNASTNLDNITVANSNQLIQMTTSLIENIKNDSIMTQSLDPTCLLNNSKNLSTSNIPQESQLKQFTEQPLSQLPVMGGPLTAASKMVPVPESLMSPDCCPTQTNTLSNKIACSVSISSPLVTKSVQKTKDNKVNSKINRSPNLKRSDRSSPILSPRKVNTTGRLNCNNNHKSNNSVQVTPPDSSSNNTIASSDDDSDHINVDKLKTIRNKAAQKCQQNKDNIINIDQIIINKSTENSAILIQKIWRGYFTRKKTKYISEKIHKQRTQEYIEKLKEDMEMTKSALENERKIQHLQMQAINALWKKVSTMQQTVALPAGMTNTTLTDGTQQQCLDINGAGVIQDLAKTCSILNNQVQQLQGSMRDIVNCMTMMCNLPYNNNNNMNNIHDRDSSSTQTEIIAVHTPQLQQPQLPNDNNLPFPFAGIGKIARPSTLSLDSNETSPKSNNSTNTTACTDLILDKTETTTPIDSNKIIDENPLIINNDESIIIETNINNKTSGELIINNEKIII